MTPHDFVKKWIKALRSGDYRQGRTYLKVTRHLGDGPQFCCLGVACDVAVKHGLLIEDGQRGYSRYSKRDDEPTSSVLPVPFADWLNVDSDPFLTRETTATNANDCREMTFDQIADLIETNILPTMSTETRKEHHAQR